MAETQISYLEISSDYCCIYKWKQRYEGRGVV